MNIQRTIWRGWLTGAITAALLAGIGGASSHAQGGPGAASAQTQSADFRTLTAEQRQQLAEMTRSYTRKLTIQMMLKNAGFTDEKILDAVVSFTEDQEKALQPLQEEQTKLLTAATGEDNTDPEVVAMLADFHKAVNAEKDRRKTALDALDAKINYSKQPRLAAALTVLGLTGDDMAIATGSNAGMMMGGMGSFGGRGGFGGGPGGFGGGPGGFGGGGPGGGGPGGFGGGPGGGGPGGGGPGGGGPGGGGPGGVGGGPGGGGPAGGPGGGN